MIIQFVFQTKSTTITKPICLTHSCLRIKLLITTTDGLKMDDTMRLDLVLYVKFINFSHIARLNRLFQKSIFVVLTDFVKLSTIKVQIWCVLHWVTHLAATGWQYVNVIWSNAMPCNYNWSLIHKYRNYFKTFVLFSFLWLKILDLFPRNIGKSNDSCFK